MVNRSCLHWALSAGFRPLFQKEKILKTELKEMIHGVSKGSINTCMGQKSKLLGFVNIIPRYFVPVFSLFYYRKMTHMLPICSNLPEKEPSVRGQVHFSHIEGTHRLSEMPALCGAVQFQRRKANRFNQVFFCLFGRGFGKRHMVLFHIFQQYLFKPFGSYIGKDQTTWRDGCLQFRFELFGFRL